MKNEHFSEPIYSNDNLPETDLEDTFATFWDDLPATIKRFKTDEDRREAIEREQKFVTKVLSAVEALASSRTGPITILFDVDETLVKNVYDDHKESTTYVRPGLSVLMRMIDAKFGDRVDVGILTSRAQSHLDEELASPSYTQAMAGKINHGFVISSRDGSLLREDGVLHPIPRYMESGKEVSSLHAIEDIVDPQLKTAIEIGDHMSIVGRVGRGHWYDVKLAILQRVAQKHPERGFVFVDDLPFPASIDPNHTQVRGVAIDDASFNM